MSDDDDIDAELEAETESGGGLKTLSDHDFETACAMWESGQFELREIADQFGVKPLTLKRRFQRNNVERASRAAEGRAEVEREIRERARKAVERIERTREEHYAWAEALGRMAMKLVVDQTKSGQRLAGIESDMRTLERAVKVVSGVRAERYKVLGIDEEDPDEEEKMPILEVSVLDDEDVAQIRQAQEGDLDMADLGGTDIVSTGDEGS